MRSGTRELVDRHIGMRLRMARRAKKLSQERLAPVLGLSPDVLDAIEKGELRARADTLRAAAEELAIPVTTFYECIKEDEPCGCGETLWTDVEQTAALRSTVIAKLAQVESPHLLRLIDAMIDGFGTSRP